MVSPEHTAPRLAALLGGPGIDGSLNGLDDPKSAWQLAESRGLAQPASTSIELLASPDALFAQLEGSALRALVLRVDWARLEPAEGELDHGALASWVAIAQRAKAQGLEVEVVLNDGILPAWLGTEGWLLPATPERFADLARSVTAAMGEHLEGVVTLEAPARFAFAGWVLGLVPPFRRWAPRDAAAALDGMLSGHLLALEVLSAEAPSLERSLLPSSGHLGELEAALLGAPTELLPEALSSVLASQGPGRARALASGRTDPWGTIGWAVVGRARSARPSTASLDPRGALWHGSAHGRRGCSVDSTGAEQGAWRRRLAALAPQRSAHR